MASFGVSTFASRARYLGIPIAIIVISVVLAVSTSRFLTVDNLSNVAEQISLIGIVAMGMAVLLVSGNFDLSIGGIVALTGVVSALVANEAGLAMGILAGLSLGLLLGAVNGFVVVFLHVNSLMATLGTALVFTGFGYLLSGTRPVILEDRSLVDFVNQKLVLSLAPSVIIFVVVIAFAAWFLHGTVLGLQIFAVGGNADAARYAGVRTRLIQFLPFCLTGLFSAIASILVLGQLGTSLPDAGGSWALQVIAAAVVGGVSIAGGRGTIAMAFAGVLLIGIVNNGLNLLGFDPAYQNIITGLIIVFAVASDAYLQRRGSKSGLRKVLPAQPTETKEPAVPAGT